METETYKNAKLILERFDPDAKKKAVSPRFLWPVVLQSCLDSLPVVLQEQESTPVRPQMTPRPGQGNPPPNVLTPSEGLTAFLKDHMFQAEIRQRGVPMRPTPMGTPVSMAMTPPPGARPPLGPGGTPVGKQTERLHTEGLWVGALVLLSQLWHQSFNRTFSGKKFVGLWLTRTVKIPPPLFWRVNKHLNSVYSKHSLVLGESLIGN